MHSMMFKCTWPVLEKSQSPTSFFTFLLFPFPPCSPEASAEPVPPSPGRWSQDLLGGIGGYVNRALFVIFFFSICFHAHNYLFISGESSVAKSRRHLGLASLERHTLLLCLSAVSQAR